MISGIVVACMAVFMVIGAADKALFNNRFGYGEEFERGLAAMGPLAMCLVGIMCAAPAVGRAVAPALSPLFTAIGSDPSVAAGMIFGIDSGGLTLSIALASTREAAMLSGLGLAASMGCIITYALPVSLSMCAPESRPAVAKGLAAGIAAAPVSLFGVAAVSGYSLTDADLFITGEGRLDSQTARGKAPAGAARFLKRLNPKCVAVELCGSIGERPETIHALGIDAFFPIIGIPATEASAMDPETAKDNLRRTAAEAVRFFAAARSAAS